MTIGIDASRAFVKERTGTENYSWNLIYWLTKLDQVNRYFLYLKGSQDINFELPANFWVKRIGLPRLWTQAGLASRTFFDSLDVLFIPAHTLPLLRPRSLKTVVTIHGLEYEYLPQHYQFPQKLFLTRSTQYAVRQADCLIAVSSWTKRELVRRLGADPKKIRVIYEGVDVNKFKIQKSTPKGGQAKCKIDKIKKKYKIRGDYILFVGTIQPRKNLVRLIEAFKLVLDQSSERLDLVLAGKLGWMYDKIVSAPKRLGIGRRVKFLGHVPESVLPALYRGARLFCLPSLMEGFGLPVLEAMAAGTPVVASKVGALPEVVGKAGLLVDPLKTGEIAKAMRLVLENRALAGALREKGFSWVKKFSWQRAARKTLKVFKGLEDKTTRC
jgi:glycosyltransferase involved in cell wall biosynthesis